MPTHSLQPDDTPVCTVGPLGTSGEIGSKLQNFQLTKFEKFVKVETFVPVTDRQILKHKNDDLELYNYNQFVATGHIDPKYEYRQPTPMHMARWKTPMTRVLNLYVREKKPSKSLKIMVKFVQKCYAPTFFQILEKPLIQDAPSHYFNFWKLCKENLPKDCFEHVQKYFNINAHYLHSENVLLAGKYYFLVT